MLRVESKNVYFYLLRHLLKGKIGKEKGNIYIYLNMKLGKGLDLGIGVLAITLLV